MIEELERQFGELHETHISWVLLGDELAFKIKKPVDLGFLDFSDVASRRAACDAEVRLNRRLAPHVYIGVVPVTRDGVGGYGFDGKGEIVDWAVKMHRLSDEARADVRLERGLLTSGDLVRVAARLADFHSSASAAPEISVFGRAAAIERNVCENFEQMAAALPNLLTAEQVEELESWQRSYLSEWESRFAVRVDAGRIRDGHGDLRLEHVYFDGDQEPTIIDCIEFNDRFRYGDVCSDVAFLAMDLMFSGRTELAEKFLAAYAQASDDYDLYSVVDFYVSYRACVRAKVATFNAAGARCDARRSEHMQAARRYLLLALAAKRRRLVPQALIAVGGVIGTGKSTTAGVLADELACAVIESDRIRKRLLGKQPHERQEDAAWTGAYTSDATDRVYAELCRRAAVVLESGRSAVLDASFRKESFRRRARQVAEEHGVGFRFVECEAPATVCRARLRERAKTASTSDGREAIFDEFVRRYESPTELQENERLTLDTSQPAEAWLERLRDFVAS